MRARSECVAFAHVMVFLLRLGHPLISPVLNQLRADVHAKGRDAGELLLENMLAHACWETWEM